MTRRRHPRTSLRIACDLDGTLADLESALQREADSLFGPGVDVRAANRRFSSWRQRSLPSGAQSVTSSGGADFAGAIPLDARAERLLWEHISRIENFWTTLSAIEPRTVSRLAAMAAVRGWEVLFLTQRPETAGATAQIQTQRWLQAHGFELPSVFVVSGARGTLAAALTLDAVLDDSPDTCLDVVSDSRARPILVWRHGAERVPPGVSRLPIDVVFSAADALDQLIALEAPEQSPLGRLTRFRHAMGSG